LEIVKNQIDGYDCYSISGDLDIENGPKTKELIDEIINGGERTILLDMSNVEYIDSTGIGVIIGTMKNLKNLNGKLILLNLPEPIHLLFEKTRLLLFFQIAKDTSEIPKLLALDNKKK
jgi:anti-sigma B factor antagonist